MIKGEVVIYFLKTYSVVLFFLFTCLEASVTSTTGNIYFDINDDGDMEMTLNEDGLSIGMNSAAAANLHVNGNAIIEKQLSLGPVTGGSNFLLTGTFASSPQTVSSNTTLGSHSWVFVDSSSHEVTCTLPSVSSSQGQLFFVKQVDASNNVVIIANNSSTAIDDRDMFVLSSFASVQLMSSGTQWFVMDCTTGGSSQSTGLVAYWNFDETTGTAASGSSIFQQHGTLHGGLDFSSDSVLGNHSQALAFDGVDDYITVSDSSHLDLKNQGSISLWVKSNSTAAPRSNMASWHALTAPDGSGAGDKSEVDSTLVGNVIYYAAVMADNDNVNVKIGSSGLDGSGQSTWVDLGTEQIGGGFEGGSIGVDSDGEKLYMARFGWDRDVENFSTASCQFDGSGNSVWTSHAQLDGAGQSDQSSIDMVVVNDKMYIVLALSNDSSGVIGTANCDLDGANFSGWTTLASFGGTGSTGGYSVSVDSNGEQLFYNLFSHDGTSGTTGNCAMASSALGGGSFSGWTSLSTPTATTGAGESVGIDCTIAGNVIYSSLFVHDSGAGNFLTSHIGTDFSSFSGWTTETLPSQPGDGESANTSVCTDGDKLYVLGFSHDQDIEQLHLSNANLNASQPILKKANAYELYLNGGGFVLDWNGRPQSSGNIQAGEMVHYAMTHDGTTMKTYINGQLKRSQAVTMDFLVNDNDLNIGGNGTFLNGVLDEVKIYDRALTVSEIETIYNNGK